MTTSTTRDDGPRADLGVPGTSEPTPAQARRAAWAVVAFVAVLPLQWQVLANSPAGVVRWFHVGTLVMLAVASWRAPRFRDPLGGLAVPVVAMGVLTVMCVTAAVTYAQPWSPPLQHLAYFAVGIVLAAVLGTALARPEGRRVLVWCAPLSVVLTLAALLGTLAARGVAPGGVLSLLHRGVTEPDPTLLIRGLFQRALSPGGVGEALAAASVRHEVVAALLVVCLVTLSAGRVRAPSAVVAGVGVAAAVVLILLSLSRSVQVPLAIGAVMVLAMGVRRARADRTTALVGVGVLTAAAAVALVLGPVLFARAGSTGSYIGRTDTFSGLDLRERVLSGGPELPTSTHVLVTDSLARAGWLAGLAALVIVAVVARRGLGALVAFVRTNALVHAVAGVALALVFVRLFSIGSGYLHQVEWAAFGLAVALVRHGTGPGRPDRPATYPDTPGTERTAW